jgi:AraC-like DNA-binding protein
MNRLVTHLKDVVGAFDLYRSRSPRPQQTQPTVLHAPPGEQFIMRERLRGMLSEQRQRRSGWQAAMYSGLLDLIVTVARLHQSTIVAQQTATTQGSLPSLAGRSEQAVLDVANHIETHFRESLTLAELSSLVHLSAPHLSRCFGKKMGMSLIDYIHRVRSEEACRLLRCTSERVTSIASRVGYAEVAYFSRRFRAQTGQSPRQYRNAWQDTAQYFHPPQ